MNKRMQELAIEAAGKGFKTFATSDFDSPEKIERFAELIVRECAEFARQHNLEKADRSHLIHRAIQQHFGVKE